MSISSAFAELDGGDASPAAELTVPRRHPQLTYVELVDRPGRVEHAIRFGLAADTFVVDRRRRFAGFAPGSVFAFARSSSNSRGETVSRLDVLQAVRRSASCSTIPGVTPGAEILARFSGVSRVRAALAAIAGVDALGVDPADAAPDYWRHVGQRLSVGEAARRYTHERHAAWLARRELAP